MEVAAILIGGLQTVAFASAALEGGCLILPLVSALGRWESFGIKTLGVPEEPTASLEPDLLPAVDGNLLLC